jgi:DNA-binding MurR/RpiR family transcriptional regulator
MNISPFESIKTNLFQLTKKEQLIAEYILNDPQRIIQFGVDDLVRETHTSKSAFIRFCKKLGYDGYSEFRFAISRELVGTPDDTHSSTFISMVTTSYGDFIQQLNTSITVQEVQAFSKAVIKAKRVKIVANNRTALSAQHLRMRMGKIGLDAEMVNDLVTMRDIAEYLDKDDLVIIYSIKLLDLSYKEIITAAASHQCSIICVTMTPSNANLDLVTQVVTLPFISKSSSKTFLDDQPIFMIFNEILLNELARDI